MKCPNCGTWNPDDKIKCWRCSTELPKPQPKKQPQATRIVGGLPVWAWVLLGFMLALWFLFQCSAPIASR